MPTSVSPGVLEDDDPPPGVRRRLVSCDESGIHGDRFYAFGSLWMPWQRRGDFQEWIREVRAAHPEHLSSQFKWNYIDRHTLPTYRDLVELFFRRVPLSFHCLLVEKAVIDKERHGGDYDLARRKFQTKLLTCRVQHALRVRPDREQTFRVWIDPIPSRYDKADDVMEIISNHVMNKARSRRIAQPIIDQVIEHRAQDTVSIQLCDVLLGAVAAAWQREPARGAKLALQQFIAEHLAWTDLKADTYPTERKFNIWMFYDPTKQRRRVATRDVALRYPLPLLPTGRRVAA
jgi:hypothetical protein